MAKGCFAVVAGLAAIGQLQTLGGTLTGRWRDAMKLIVLVGLLFSTALFAAPQPWLFKYPVKFDSLGEQRWLVLADGTEVELAYGIDGRLSFDQVKQWSEGQELAIAYSPEDGEVLIDPTNGNWIALVHGPEKHSIDLMHDACLAVEVTTAGMVDCYRKALELWELEMQRCYSRLNAVLDPEQMAKVAEAQKKWLEFRAAETDAIGAVYHEGSISQISRVSAVTKLVRERARDLRARGGI